METVARGWKGVAETSRLGHQTPSRFMLTQNPIRVKVFLLKLIGTPNSGIWTVGSRHTLSGKQRAAAVNGYWHRAPDDSIHKRNPRQRAASRCCDNGYVQVQWHGGNAAILSLCVDSRTSPISYANHSQA